MWSQSRTTEIEILLQDDVPGRITSRHPGCAILPHGYDPVEMPQADDDPFPASSLLMDAPYQREGEVFWEVAISDNEEIIALASFSEALSGPDKQYYSLILDKVFVHPDHRGQGIGMHFVTLMGEVFRERIETIPSIDPACSYMNCEPASEGGEALADRMTVMRREILAEVAMERDLTP